MPSLSRRSFLKTAAWASAGAALSARSWGQVAGANSDIRVGVVGLNGRGKSHVKGFGQVPGVRVAALCDVDSAVLDKVAAGERAAGRNPQTFGDVRELIASRDIDAITIATPNHWHALIAIWALEGGKDVYIEKPVCHNIWEGRQLVSAAAKSSRVVQVGTQIRSGGVADAVAWVRAGNLGKVLVSRGLCYKRRPSIGRTHGAQEVPATVNYDLWLGPAPFAPPRRKQFHYDWHWFWATGNGDIGNQGIHEMDVARWFLGEPGLAPRSLSVGGRLGYVDDGQTPNTQVIVHDYPSAPLVFEVRGLPAKTGAPAMDKFPDAHGASIGNVVHCEGGTVVSSSYTTAQAYDRSGNLLKSFEGSGAYPSVEVSHMANFIDVMRSRKTADLHGPIADGYASSALCHLANISHRLGSPQPPELVQEKINGNAALTEAYGRMIEHLANNGVSLDQKPATLGVPLIFDPAAEQFPGNAEANALLSRDYRAPYVVPDFSHV